ncbi:malonate decarboxylase holo-[acyl-carrier-protein] synthase [Burkholderia guangdongensis]|uniref:malonate decarboxylase holo-[acyl-carrier-protein] synthase n=1 Tax=Burkholderia guangdongensis TaxID=1792500 RepID=UPI0015C7CEEB
MPPSDVPLRRHTLVTLTAHGWAALLAGDASLAGEPLVRTWAERGWPLVVRRALPGDAAVPLGLPLPPSAGKRRIAVTVARDALASACPPPALDATLDVAPSAWRPTLAELHALGERCGAPGRVFGSLAWQALTGLTYLSATSDLDVLFPLPRATCVAVLLEGVAAIDARAPMRVDGELVRDDGAGVNWRELHARLPEVAVKTAADVELCAADDFLGAAR